MECSCKDPEEVVRAPGLRWVCSTAGRKQNLQPNSSRFTGGWRQNSLRAVACQEETAMSPKPFIFSSLGAAGCRAWSGDSIPWDCDRIEREKSGGAPREHLPVSQLLLQSTAGIPGSPNREHLTIAMAEQAVLLCKNRINFVLPIHSAFLDKCHQGHS